MRTGWCERLRRGRLARVLLALLALAILFVYLIAWGGYLDCLSQAGVGGERLVHTGDGDCPTTLGQENGEEAANESRVLVLRDILEEDEGADDVPSPKPTEDTFGIGQAQLALDRIVDSANAYVSKGLVALANGIKPSFVALLEEEYRFFDSNMHQRRTAYKLFKSVETLPILSPYSKASAADLFGPEVATGLSAFGSPTRIFVSSDRFVVRFLQSQGALNASDVYRADLTEEEERSYWQVLAENFHLLLGTSSRMWIEQTLTSVFGVHDQLNGANAQRVYDLVVFKLNTTEYAPRALARHFGIGMLGTSPPASGDVALVPPNATAGADGAEAAPDSDGAGEAAGGPDEPGGEAEAEGGAGGGVGDGDVGAPEGVKPTFVPDELFRLKDPEWKANVVRLGERAGVKIDSYSNFVRALEVRRAQFKALGAVATFQETRVPRAELTPLPEMEALFAAALSGRTNDKDLQIFQNHMVMEMARMSVEDGLVMQLHTGLERNYLRSPGKPQGKDSGGGVEDAPIDVDIPIAVDFSHGLRPLLNTYGNHRNLTLVLFTHDESTYSRELAPLAVQYQSVKVGSPLWFHENPEGIKSFLDSVVGLCGIHNLAGYVDNANHFLQIPSRHKIWRKVVSDWVARLVLEGRVQEKDAYEMAKQLAYTAVKTTYNL